MNLVQKDAQTKRREIYKYRLFYTRQNEVSRNLEIGVEKQLSHERSMQTVLINISTPHDTKLNTALYRTYRFIVNCYCNNRSFITKNQLDKQSIY